MSILKRKRATTSSSSSLLELFRSAVEAGNELTIRAIIVRKREFKTPLPLSELSAAVQNIPQNSSTFVLCLYEIADAIDPQRTTYHDKKSDTDKLRQQIWNLAKLQLDNLDPFDLERLAPLSSSQNKSVPESNWNKFEPNPFTAVFHC